MNTRWLFLNEVAQETSAMTSACLRALRSSARVTLIPRRPAAQQPRLGGAPGVGFCTRRAAFERLRESQGLLDAWVYDWVAGVRGRGCELHTNRERLVVSQQCLGRVNLNV
jgi:hypothetical protein